MNGHGISARQLHPVDLASSPAPTDSTSVKGGQAKKPKRKRPKAVKAAALEDVLLGLAEGDNASSVNRSSPVPPQSDPFDMDDEELKPSLAPDSIVQPSGLTRAEVIAKIESNDMYGLTQEDVKAVQDEMWKRHKSSSGTTMLRKDGTTRKKPGPSKGWKLFKDGPLERRPGSVRGDGDSEAGESSVAGETVNGEAEAEIAALMGDDATPGAKKSRSKKRKIDDAESELLYAASEDGQRDDMSVDDLALSLLEDATPNGGKKKGKPRPSAAKGAPIKPKDGSLTRKAEDPWDEGDVYESAVPPVPEQDPRGVSEIEAKSRYQMVEDIQKIAWAGIVKDIPRVSSPIRSRRKLTIGISSVPSL